MNLKTVWKLRRVNLNQQESTVTADHRIVMALAIAGLMTEGETIIDTAEAVAITFPNFVNCVQEIGGDIHIVG